MTRGILKFLPNQPFAFYEPASQEECCNCDEGYCRLYQPGDIIKIEMQQRWGDYDTKPNIICARNFQDFTSSELATNPGFTGSAASWTLTNMAYGADDIGVVSSASPSGASQTIAITTGELYLVTIVVKSMTQGAVYVKVGGTFASNYVSSPGTYQFLVKAGAGSDLEYSSSALFSLDPDAVIDFIGVRQYSSYCWDFSNGAGYQFGFIIDEAGLTKTPGFAWTFYNRGTGVGLSTSRLFTGLYAFRIKIKNRTQGTFTINVGGSQFVFDENGEFTKFKLVPTGSEITEYKWDDEFDGTIEFIDCFPLYSPFSGDGFVMQMVDMAGNFMGSLVPYLSYEEDFVFVYASMDSINFGANPYGCYKIQVADPLSSDAYLNQLPQGDFADASLWTVPGGGGITINDTTIPDRVGKLFVSVTGTISTNVTLNDGELYYLWLNRVQNTAPYTVQIKYGGVVLSTTPGYGSALGFIVSAPANDLLEITITGLTSNTLFEEALIYKDYSSHTDYDFESSCISYKEIHECTKVIIAYSPGRQLGFYFPTQLAPIPINDYISTVFDLRQRLKVLSFNPSYPTGQDILVQSDGNDELTFASRKKFKILHFDSVDETMHDCISAMRLCSYFFIYPSSGIGSPAIPEYDAQYRYVAKKEDYVPENDKDGRRNLTQSRIEVSLKNNNIFFTKEV